VSKKKYPRAPVIPWKAKEDKAMSLAKEIGTAVYSECRDRIQNVRRDVGARCFKKAMKQVLGVQTAQILHSASPLSTKDLSLSEIGLKL